SAHGDGWSGGGRSQSQAMHLEVYGGVGQVDSISGSVRETRDGGEVSGGLYTDLNDLGINDGSESLLIGGKFIWKWLSLLVDYRSNTIDASGTSESELRLNVDSIAFQGLDLEYLLIPVDSTYQVDSTTDLLGLGLRFTPLTLNPRGRIRFTPWLHLGVQYIQTDFSIDSGNTIRLEAAGFQNRVYAVRGRASGTAELVIPEYGLGAELRMLFHEPNAAGPELAAYATWKILDFDGSLDTIGVEADDFENLVFEYSALELGVNLYFPLGTTAELLAGVYLEQVEVNTELTSKPSAGDFQREVDLDYTLLGVRAGIRF
ncbi:MAG: hypothetical protein PF795_15565, partial [Kiritimatiellae bacterium]|nr:hypothetical protein [Kiritimatiellia bacterium]